MTDYKIFLIIFTFITGCSMQQTKVPVVDHVDIDKFMGDWYVIAHIPTFIEKIAYNAVETYALNADGTIATTFIFNKGGFDGPQKIYRPKGFVVPNTGNAEWGMQFIWPIKAQYKISYLDSSYTNTIIARDALDYVWLMSRDKNLSEAEIIRFTELIKSMGYNVDNLRRVPHE